MRVVPLSAVVAFLAAAPLAAQPHGLRHSANLGEEKVGDTRELDVLQTGGTYSQIRICAWRSPVRLFDATVMFHDGSQHTLRARRQGAIIPASGCTNWLYLSQQKPIEAVHMTYWAEIFGPMRANVEVRAR